MVERFKAAGLNPVGRREASPGFESQRLRQRDTESWQSGLMHPVRSGTNREVPRVRIPDSPPFSMACGDFDAVHAERWPRGLRHRLGKATYPHGYREFESRPLRQNSSMSRRSRIRRGSGRRPKGTDRWVRGRNHHTANVANLRVPWVRIPPCPPFHESDRRSPQRATSASWSRPSIARS